MKLATYHCHTTFCDGKSTPEETVQAAIALGFSELGISAHSPIPGSDFTMKQHRINEYVKELHRLKEKYRDRIKLYLGIESDIVSETDLTLYDYVIGAAHLVRPQGKMIDVDHTAEITRSAITDYYGGDPYAYCEAYYAEVERVYEKTKCDIIAHFDLVTKFIERDPIFSTEHPRYIAARDKALEVLLATPAVFEVNTGAISRGYRTSPYPESAVLKRIAEAGKKVLINSDAHHADNLDHSIDAAAKMLDAMGVGYYTSLEQVLAITRA